MNWFNQSSKVKIKTLKISAIHRIVTERDAAYTCHARLSSGHPRELCFLRAHLALPTCPGTTASVSKKQKSGRLSPVGLTAGTCRREPALPPRPSGWPRVWARPRVQAHPRPSAPPAAPAPWSVAPPLSGRALWRNLNRTGKLSGIKLALYEVLSRKRAELFRCFPWR